MVTLPINSVPADNDLLVPSPTLETKRRGLELSPVGAVTPPVSGIGVLPIQTLT